MKALGFVMCIAVLFVLGVAGLGMMGQKGELLTNGAANLSGYPKADQTLMADLAASAEAVYDLNDHMFDHPESAAIVKCLNDKGPALKFRAPDKKTFYLLCQIPDGRWGFGEYVNNGTKKPDPVTAFVREDGTITKVVNYVLKWASRWKGALPWEQ